MPQLNDDWVFELKRIKPSGLWSQYGEEAYISHIFKNIGIKNHFYVDFGAGDGVNLSNTKHLQVSGWDGLMMDGDNHGNKLVQQEHITRENIVDLFTKYKVPIEFDFLSIDIDGNDYWVLEELLKHYTPRLILAEINGTIPVNVDKTIKYNPNHVWNGDDYYGASYLAFKRLGNEYGYTPIYIHAHTNVFLIKNQLLNNHKNNFMLSYIPQQYHPHNSEGEWIVF